MVLTEFGAIWTILLSAEQRTFVFDLMTVLVKLN